VTYAFVSLNFLGGADATERATTAVGVIGGLIFTRYLSPIRSIAELPAERVRQLFAPALRAALESRVHPQQPAPHVRP
jgi:Tetracyclin repressor-like, C-terminal domain